MTQFVCESVSLGIGVRVISCGCDCGRLIPYIDGHGKIKRFVKGHLSKRKTKEIECACGCETKIPDMNKWGQTVRFVVGHNSRGTNNPMYGVHRFGEEAPMYGKKLSIETRSKLSEAMKGRFAGENNPMYGVHRFGQSSPGYKGGIKEHEGYRLILSRDHPYCNKDGYVYEHRLIMEAYLGRYLRPDEDVNHIDGDRSNNKIENLEVMSHSEHAAFHQAVRRESKFLGVDIRGAD